MTDYTRVSELDFGLMMLTWSDHDVYPLEVVSSVEFTDAKGAFYLPVIPRYQPESLDSVILITGSFDGYISKLDLMSCIGRCWDLALNQRKNVV